MIEDNYVGDAVAVICAAVLWGALMGGLAVGLLWWLT